MRNYVSKVLIGTAVANTAIAPTLVADLTLGQIIAIDWDTQADIVATSKNIGFARGTAILGEAILAGPLPVASISSAILNPYKAAVKKKMTLTVSTVPTVGKTAIFKVVYHDNLSIVPNQMKQTIISVTADAANTATTTTWAAAIAAEFNKQEYKFVAVTTATNVVTFESITMTTQSNYNHIDRPETVIFEVGAPNEPELGVYVVAQTVAPSLGQGDAAKMAWMEEQAMGRRGYADRRAWNDNKQYVTQVTPGATYAVLVISADDWQEGDMQGLRANPVGAVIGGSGATLAAIITDLAVVGIVPETVAAG